MKNNDGFSNILNNNHKDDARAVSESELLPIYNGMRFSGDIQPVEDIEISDYEKIENSENTNEKQKNDSNKKKTSIKSIFNKNKKMFIAGAAALFVLVVAVVVVVIVIKNGINESPVAAVYAESDNVVILLENGKTYEINGAEAVKVSEDGMRLYFHTEAESHTDKFDLKVIDVKSKDSLRKGGNIIDLGIDEEWSLSADGSFVCYTKTDSGSKDCYMYSAEKEESKLIAENTNEIFLPEKGDIVYFTRKSGSEFSLHRAHYGEESATVVSGITHALFYDSSEGFEVLYTVKTGKESNVDVYRVTDYDAPQKICSDISELFAKEYEVSGNLYYFKKNSSKIDWRDFIDDPYFENDANMTRPVEGDFMVKKGLIFEIYTLDVYAYNAAVKAYEAKLLRDSIREELDRIDLGLAVQNSYSCYVYNGMTKELATGLNIENILSFAPAAAPRIIYAKSAIEVADKIKFDTLVQYTKSGNVARAIDYVMETVGEQSAVSNECIYSWFDSTKVLSYSVSGYEVSKTMFTLGTKDCFYAIEDGTLYSNQVTTKQVQDKKQIDVNVTKCEFKDGYLYYYKELGPDRFALYRYSPETGKKHLADNIYEYYVVEKEYVILLKKLGADTELMDIAVFSDGEIKSVDKNVSLKNFVYNGKNMSYLKNTGSYENFDSGDMYMYTPEDGVEKVKSKVTKIYFINKQQEKK